MTHWAEAVLALELHLICDTGSCLSMVSRAEAIDMCLHIIDAWDQASDEFYSVDAEQGPNEKPLVMLRSWINDLTMHMWLSKCRCFSLSNCKSESSWTQWLQCHVPVAFELIMQSDSLLISYQARSGPSSFIRRLWNVSACKAGLIPCNIPLTASSDTWSC